MDISVRCGTPATRCNTLWHTATRCNTLQHNQKEIILFIESLVELRDKRKKEKKPAVYRDQSHGATSWVCCINFSKVSSMVIVQRKFRNELTFEKYRAKCAL